MSWDELRQMTQAGMEVVSHSANHTDLGAATAEAATAEVRESRKAIQEKISQPVQALVYPYGEPFAHGSAEAQARVVEILRQEGYVVGVTNPLPNTWPQIKQDAAAPYQLKRVMVSGGMGLTRFAARLEGREPQ
jgi:peptidoglycan/xylan/chitin deacetylase (PgdA/CDA1 family)